MKLCGKKKWYCGYYWPNQIFLLSVYNFALLFSSLISNCMNKLCFTATDVMIVSFLQNQLECQHLLSEVMVVLLCPVYSFCPWCSSSCNIPNDTVVIITCVLILLPYFEFLFTILWIALKNYPCSYCVMFKWSMTKDFILSKQCFKSFRKQVVVVHTGRICWRKRRQGSWIWAQLGYIY